MQDFTSRLLRSILYVPASQQKVLKKAPTLGADALILDLEDSVPPQAKAEARIMARDTLNSVANSEVLRTVRINALNTELWQDDVKTVFSARPDGLVVPKVDSVDSLQPLIELVETLEDEASDGFRGSVWAMIESPVAVLNAYAIASHHRVDCLVMGTSDLTAALGVAPGVERGNMAFALQQTVLSAKAAGIPVIDGVFVDLTDGDGFAAQCREGAALGFSGKTVIHPRQVPFANSLYMPSDAEVERARRVLESWRKAHGRGEEICVVDGMLVERLHARRAAEILTRIFPDSGPFTVDDLP